MVLALNIFLQLWYVFSLLLHLAKQLNVQIWSDLKLDMFIPWSKENVLCVRGNEQTSLNRVHGRRVIQTLVSETLISLLPHRLKRSSFFFSHMLFVGERIII